MQRRDLYTILATRIRTGHYTPGSRLPSERALAEELGFHRNTVSRVIARLAAAGLLDAPTGCRPVVRPGGPDVRSSRTVALLMGNEPRFHAFQHVLRGCEDELSASDYRLVFMDTLAPTMEGTREKEARALSSLVEQPVSGLILWLQDPERTPATLERLRTAGTVVVAIDRIIPTLPCDHVGVDNISGACLAVEHLYALGHRRIAFATYADEPASPVLEREEGYRSCMRRLNIPEREHAVFRFPYDTAQTALAEQAAALARSADRPTAIFCVNDILAWMLHHSLLAAGLRVPEDVALIGFDDLEGLTVHPPVLSTMRLPYENLGRHAARLILWRLVNPDAPLRHVLLDTELILRSTTVAGPAPSSTPLRPVAVGTATDLTTTR